MVYGTSNWQTIYVVVISLKMLNRNVQENLNKWILCFQKHEYMNIMYKKTWTNEYYVL